jgi:hypothetical protein
VTLKKKNQKKIVNKKSYVQLKWAGFANSWNLHILLLWNQKSQEADIQDYEIW